MNVFHCIQEYKAHKQQHIGPVHYVPTMGGLHAGHLSLVKLAQTNNAQVVVGIFVNPLQFNNSNDFETYPVTLKQDLQALEHAGVNHVILPTVLDVYPHGVQGALKLLQLPEFFQKFCGMYRPGHFEGVAGVLLRFFMLLELDAVFVGKKDYQQWCLVVYLIKDFSLPIKVFGGETVRDKDGLALSTRNKNLSAKQRCIAKNLHQIMREVTTQWTLESSENVLNVCKQKLSANGFVVDYFDVVLPKQYKGVILHPNKRLLLAAAHLGAVRLIDNLVF